MNTEVENSNGTENSAPKTENSALPQRGGRPISRLTGLSDRQLEHINTWLKDHLTYRQIVDLCRTEFQQEIPYMSFVRYANRTELLRQLDALADSREAAAELSRAAVTGDPTLSTNTLELLETQAFDLAAAYQRDADADDLRTLKDLCPLINKARNTAIRERYAAVQERKCDLRVQELALKTKLADHRIALDLRKLEHKIALDLNPNLNPNPDFFSEHPFQPSWPDPISDPDPNEQTNQPFDSIESALPNKNDASQPRPTATSRRATILPAAIPAQPNQSFPPLPLPLDIIEANGRHAKLLLAGKIKTHYKRDPENSLFAKMCAIGINFARPVTTDPPSIPPDTSCLADTNPPNDEPSPLTSENTQYPEPENQD